MALGEGEVGTGGAEGIEYAAVTSCLTVTCLLDDGTHVGGHLSLMRAAGALASDEVLPAMCSLIPTDRTTTAVHLAGMLDTWNSAYLTTPLFGDNGEVDPVYIGAYLARDDLTGPVCATLGASVAASAEQRDGAFTIAFT